MNILKSILLPIAKTLGMTIAILLSTAGISVQHYQDPSVEKAPVTQLKGFGPTGGGTYRLNNSIGSTDTSISLSSFTEPISGIAYTMSYLGSTIEYGTLDPQNSTKSEFISFTGITQNSNGTAQLTGVTRGLSRTPGTGSCTASTTLAQVHSGQSFFIISNSPCFYTQFGILSNNQSITGEWTAPTPTNATDIAIKSYVDSVVGGTVTVDKITPGATAGETVSAGQVVYLKQSNGQWFKAGTAIPEASSTIIGIAQGAGTAGVAISGGVLVEGLDANQSGLTTGLNYFLSSTAGTIGSASTTRFVGRAKDATHIYVSTHSLVDSLLASNGLIDPTRIATSSFTFATSTNVWTSTTTGSNTWTKPTGAKLIVVTLIGAGGGGGGGRPDTNPQGSGGGGGAVGTFTFDANLMPATVTVTTGAGGTGGITNGNVGSAGATTTFGGYALAGGGAGGGASAATTNGGNTQAGFSTNAANACTTFTNNICGIVGGVGGAGGSGNNTVNTGGGGGGAGGTAGGSGNSNSSVAGIGGTGGTSYSFLGTGGNGGTSNGSGVIGSNYGGGGGGGSGGTGGSSAVGGNGAPGFAEVDTYF